MKIGSWTLEVLVNEIPLQEYVISDSILEVSASSALKSYVVEGNRKKFCDSATFVAVPAPGTYYSIMISPCTSEIAPLVFVDGVNDGYYVKSSDTSYSIVKGFCNENRTMRYDFIFDKTEWIETDILQRTKYGGLGAISVYFYKIINKCKLSKSSRDYSLDRAFEKVKIPEKKKCFDVTLTTKFSEGIERYSSGPSKIIREDEPLAVLHINYRSADWLIPMATSTSYTTSAIYRTNTPNSYTSASTSTSSTSTSSYTSISSTSTSTTSSVPASASTSAATTSMDIKNEVENDIKNKSLVTQSIKKRKRKYQEMIIILDSDEERTHEAVELD